MYKLPVIVPDGCVGIMTQGYIPGVHDAIDFVVGKSTNTYEENQVLSYGSQLVCPFKEATCVASEFRPDGMWGTPNPDNSGMPGGWVDLRITLDNGWTLDMHFQHCSKLLAKVGDIVHEGDVVALMGNYGPCNPMPTPEEPYKGTHCHLSMYLRAPGQNATMPSPLNYVDITQWYSGTDTSVTNDAQPLVWGMAKRGLVTVWDKLAYVFKIFNVK